MRFRIWLESLNIYNYKGEFYQKFPPNRGTSTPASDIVINTGLQPQVNSREISKKCKGQQKKRYQIAICQKKNKKI
jgi:hypothetical protein